MDRKHTVISAIAATALIGGSVAISSPSFASADEPAPAVESVEMDAQHNSARGREGDKEKGHKPRGGALIEGLVDEGLLTDEQANDISEVLEDFRPEKPEGAEQGADRPTREEHQKLMSDRTAALMDYLVDSETITEKQANDINKWAESHQPQHPTGDEGPKGVHRHGNPVAPLVDSGLLTEDEAKALGEKLDELRPDKPKEGGDAPKMTREERHERIQEGFESAIDELVDAGVLTDEQASSAVDGLRERAERGGDMRRGGADRGM